jgi:hypothetical protein
MVRTPLEQRNDSAHLLVHWDPGLHCLLKPCWALTILLNENPHGWHGQETSARNCNKLILLEKEVLAHQLLILGGQQNLRIENSLQVLHWLRLTASIHAQNHPRPPDIVRKPIITCKQVEHTKGSVPSRITLRLTHGSGSLRPSISGFVAKACSATKLQDLNSSTVQHGHRRPCKS